MSHHNNPTIIYLGIDVAKDELVLDPVRFGGLASVKNNPKGHLQVLRAVRALEGPLSVAHIVLEASGGYERPIAALLHQAGKRLSVVNPARMRHHARAEGLEAKTDPRDAALLSRFGDVHRPAPTPAPTAVQRELAELSLRRTQLIELHTMEANRA